MQTIRPIATTKFDTRYLHSSNSSTAEQSPLSFSNDTFFFNRQNDNFQLPERMFSPTPSHYLVANGSNINGNYNAFNAYNSSESFTSFDSFGSYDDFNALKSHEKSSYNVYCNSFNHTNSFNANCFDDENDDMNDVYDQCVYCVEESPRDKYRDDAEDVFEFEF